MHKTIILRELITIRQSAMTDAFLDSRNLETEQFNKWHLVDNTL